MAIQLNDGFRKLFKNECNFPHNTECLTPNKTCSFGDAPTQLSSHHSMPLV